MQVCSGWTEKPQSERLWYSILFVDLRQSMILRSQLSLSIPGLLPVKPVRCVLMAGSRMAFVTSFSPRAILGIDHLVKLSAPSSARAMWDSGCLCSESWGGGKRRMEPCKQLQVFHVQYRGTTVHKPCTKTWRNQVKSQSQPVVWMWSWKCPQTSLKDTAPAVGNTKLEVEL